MYTYGMYTYGMYTYGMYDNEFFLMIFLSFNHCELQDRSTFDLVFQKFQGFQVILAKSFEKSTGNGNGFKKGYKS